MIDRHLQGNGSLRLAHRFVGILPSTPGVGRPTECLGREAAVTDRGMVPWNGPMRFRSSSSQSLSWSGLVNGGQG